MDDGCRSQSERVLAHERTNAALLERIENAEFESGSGWPLPVGPLTHHAVDPCEPGSSTLRQLTVWRHSVGTEV